MCGEYSVGIVYPAPDEAGPRNMVINKGKLP